MFLIIRLNSRISPLERPNSNIFFDDDDDDDDVKEEDEVKEKEEEMSRKSKFSQNNLLKCLIKICLRRYYNLRIRTDITKCCSPSYKMRRLDLLQNAAPFITQYAHYYKMRQSVGWSVSWLVGSVVNFRACAVNEF